MMRYIAILFLSLLCVSASAKSLSSTGDTNAQQANGLKSEQRTARPDVRRFFIVPQDSTLPPVVTSASWQHSSADTNEQDKDRSAVEELGGSRWSNEIVRQRSLAGRNQDDETESTSNETSSRQIASPAQPVRNSKILEDKTSVKVRGSSGDSDDTASKQVTKNRKNASQSNRVVKDRSAQRQFDYDTVAEETSDVDATERQSGGVKRSLYDDDDADYDVAGDDYEATNDDVEYYNDDPQVVDKQQENEEVDQKKVNDKESVGREGVVYQEYEVSADSSRELDIDNAEVVDEVQVVNQRVPRRRRKGRPRTTKKKRTKNRKRRRKRPPIEPVGPVKKPTRKRRPTGAGVRRRKTKARRRRKGQANGERRRRRKNRRNQQTSSTSFDLGNGIRNENKFEQSYNIQQVDESAKPRLQQLSSIIQSLQQQYQQQQQNGYNGHYYSPRYVDVHDGRDRRRLVPAATDVRGQTSQQAAVNRGGIRGRIPPVPVHRHQNVQLTSPRPDAAVLPSRYFDSRQYYQLQQQQQQQQQQYINRHSQQHQQQQHPQHPRQYFPSYRQQQSATPTYSRHQQQIHVIVPSSDLDLQRISQVMSALGLDHISGQQPVAANEAQLQSFIGQQRPSPNSVAYREAEGNPASIPAGKNLQRDEVSSSVSDPASTSAVVQRSQHARQQRSTSSHSRALKTTEEDDDDSADDRSRQQARRRERLNDDDDYDDDDADDDDEDADVVVDDDEYIDNSDIDITTRSPTHQTTPLGLL